MTLEILIVFSILGGALLLFFTGWIRMDIVALLVIGTLAFTGLLTPHQALAGFSNPAVITVWAMFILSAALYQTGVARIIGRQLIYLAGHSEIRLIIMIMLSSGFMSAFMNNIGVAALMLPVVMDLARSTNTPPSRLLMPLAYGCLLGGLTTLIGTPPNLLISYALEDAGETPFRLFDYTPVGLGAVFGGVLFVAFIGRFLLPRKDVIGETSRQAGKTLQAAYALQERTFMVHVRPSSQLVGKTLEDSRLRAGLGLNVLSIVRNNINILDPGPQTIIKANDKLHVQGRVDTLTAMKQWQVMLPDETGLKIENLLQYDLQIFEAVIPEQSAFAGKRLRDTDFRKRLGINVLALKKEDRIQRSLLHDMVLQAGDTLLLQGPRDRVAILEKEEKISGPVKVSPEMLTEEYKLHEVLFLMEVTEDTELFERAIAESQIGSAFGLTVLGSLAKDGTLISYAPDQSFEHEGHLLVKGDVRDLPLLRGLKDLQILEETPPGVQSLESEDIQMAEIVLAPRTLLAGKTLREINFRKKYGLTVLAIWREGRAYRTNLHDLPLRFGEALLLYGRRDKLELIGSEPDFIMLTQMGGQPMRTNKALTSILVMAAVLTPVLLGFVPLAIAAVIGIALMVLTGCLKMEEAYRAIEWRAVFLIAGMLPLGTAMQETGAASLVATGVVDVFGTIGPWGVIAGLYLFTALATLAIPPPALVVIMAPIALEAAGNYGISPQAMMMAIAMAAAACFMSPLSHPANLLVMGPGGYKFSHYLKVGIPLTLVVMAMVMILLPIFWPL
ncbi:MAG: SLC13 family permease [Bacteroidia bacterium]|nr:MAG: SLC13 family permease [Bacteroidia bacterium]